MTYTVLDIGAGSCTFGRILKSQHAPLRMTVFCGEPAWGIGPFFGPIPDKKKEEILRKGRPGIWRVSSEYGRLEFPDASLDLVTLNAPHPFMTHGLDRLAGELQRCLKPSGMFFSSYPRFDFGRPPSDFKLLRTGPWKDGRGMEFRKLPKTAAYRFPQSPCVSSNIRTHRYGDPRSWGTGYIYSDGISPGYKLWQKP